MPFLSQWPNRYRTISDLSSRGVKQPDIDNEFIGLDRCDSLKPFAVSSTASRTCNSLNLKEGRLFGDHVHLTGLRGL